MKPQAILIGGLVAGAAVIAGILLVSPVMSQTAALSGYIEGEPLYPASPLSGRLVEIAVKRGDVVAAGQTLFTIDPAQGQSRLDQALAELAAAKALASDARKGQRPAELGVLEARRDAAQAQLQEAERTLARVRPLFEAGAVSQAQLDVATATRDTAAAEVNAAAKTLQAARLGNRTDQIAASEDRVRVAEAAVAGARAQLKDQSQAAPAAGRIEDVFFQEGEWTPANQPVLSFIPDGRVRIRFFAPEVEASRYAIGREISFNCDGCPPNLSATVSYVSPRPEFTPPIIYSRESRDRMVFLVEATPNTDVKLNPGLPVDVTPLPPLGEG